MKANDMHFKVDVPALMKEITENAATQNGGALKIPMNVFRMYLIKVAGRAIELNDPELNILMLEMKLYEVPHREIPAKIEEQRNRLTTTSEK